MKFSVGECVSFGWDTFKKRSWFFVGVTSVVFIVSWIGNLFASESDGTSLQLLGLVVSTLVSIFIGMGETALYLHAEDNLSTVEIKDLWHPQQFWKYVGAAILSGIIIAVGFVLLIVPGIIFSLMFMFVGYLVIDRKLGPVEALRESKRITDGHKWDLLLLFLAIIGINILGMLCLLVGLLASIPVTLLAMVHAYHTLEHKANEVAPRPAA